MVNILKRLIAKLLRKSNEEREWDSRIQDVLSCPDNQFIPRAAEAGHLKSKFQVMHNGLKVRKDGYYGKGITRMLAKNKGVHEPQEERVFQEVLKLLPPESTMIELGAYWSFYSMWFLDQISGGKTFLFEPDARNLAIGKLNFEANRFNGDFTNAYIGDLLDLAAQPPTLTVDYIVEHKKIGFIDVLHCDIQSHELDMLKGATGCIEKDLIRYFFISTHSNELHRSCLSFLVKYNYIIVCEADLFNSYSFDGLIVARSPNHNGIPAVGIAHK
ncbi:MAG TPA: FkbM family methyltransferase [Mucilaginibacter sp.]|jgi:hypothetical protein|nr:FkbM family methyltransferase [Mucilaginibacter sp.]